MTAQDRWSRLIADHSVARIAGHISGSVPIDDPIALDALILAILAAL